MSKNIVNNLLLLAEKSTSYMRHSCVIVKKGKVISSAYNSLDRTRVSGRQCSSAHAEHLALHYLL